MIWQQDREQLQQNSHRPLGPSHLFRFVTVLLAVLPLVVFLAAAAAPVPLAALALAFLALDGACSSSLSRTTTSAVVDDDVLRLAPRPDAGAAAAAGALALEAAAAAVAAAEAGGAGVAPCGLGASAPAAARFLPALLLAACAWACACACACACAAAVAVFCSMRCARRRVTASVRRWSLAATGRVVHGVSKSKLVCAPRSGADCPGGADDVVLVVLTASRAVTAGIVSTTRARKAARSSGPRLTSCGARCCDERRTTAADTADDGSVWSRSSQGLATNEAGAY